MSEYDPAYITVANYFIEQSWGAAASIQRITGTYEAELAKIMDHAVFLESDKEELDKLVTETLKATNALREAASNIAACLMRITVNGEEE